MQLTRVHSMLMTSRVHSSVIASRVNPASFISGPRIPSPIPNKPNAGSGSMIGIANYPFSNSRSSFRLSSKSFEPTYEVFARRMFSVNAKTKTMPQEPAAPKKKATRSRKEVDLSHSPATAPTKKATRSRNKEDDTKLKIFDALPKPQEPPISKLPQQPKPPTVNGTRSIKLKPLYPPVGKSVVVVESQTKAKVIQRYLGDMYQVVPSYGHVRDLAAKSHSVRPDDDFSMV